MGIIRVGHLGGERILGESGVGETQPGRRRHHESSAGAQEALSASFMGILDGRYQSLD